MDRQIIYPGMVPLDTDQLSQTRNTHIALGRLLDGLYGSSAVTSGGFACTPGNGLQVNVAPGMVCVPFQEDPVAFGSLPPDANPMVRQYLSQAPLSFSAPAGSTTYIWAVCSSADTGQSVLPFYNPANPSQTFAGQGNSGAQLPTVRQDIATVAAGSSVPQNGVLLWTVVVPSGATSISASMLMKSGVIQPTIPQLAPKDSPIFTTQLEADYGGGGFSYKLQTDGTAVWYNGSTVLFAIGGTGAYTNQPFTAYANINGKYDYVGNGSAGVGGGLHAGGPSSRNFQWSGGPTANTNPIGATTNGFMAANGGIFGYSTNAAALYLGTGVVNGPISNFYSNSASVIGAITNNNNTGVSYTSNSDYRLKTDVDPIGEEEAWCRIELLQPKSYHMIGAHEVRKTQGFIAHEFGESYPDRTFGAKDGMRDDVQIDGFDKEGRAITSLRTVEDYQRIEMLGVIPDLVVLVQALMRRVAVLEASVDGGHAPAVNSGKGADL